MERLIFCVDGGGTGSRARLADRSGALLARAESGPCNPTTDTPRALASLAELWRAAAAAAGIDAGRHERVDLAVGAAGLVLPASRQAFRAGLPAFASVTLMADGYAALIGACGGRPAGLVVMGTGAVGHRLHSDGTSVQRDGWGWIGGDRGAGAWIGREAVAQMLAARDGIAPESGLTRAVAAALGGDDTAVLGWLAAAGQARLASLVPEVAAAASAGDAAASALFDRSADHGAALAASLRLDPGEPLFAAGSVAQLLRPRLEARLGRAFDRPAGDALDGCFLVATGAAPAERRR